MSDPSVNNSNPENETPRQKNKLPAPEHLGVDEHNRWRVPPNGLPLNDKDYDYLVKFPLGPDIISTCLMDARQLLLMERYSWIEHQKYAHKK